MARSAEPPVIALRVDSIARLFDAFDPFPMPTRDLSRSAEQYIVEWAQELPRHAPPRIVLMAPEAETLRSEAKGLAAAISNHFRARAEAAQHELHELFKIGRTSLFIGLAVLAVCVLVSTLIDPLLPAALARFFGEGLVILGWVANWRPIEIFLYEWWPIRRRRRLFERLAAAEVEVRAL